MDPTLAEKPKTTGKDRRSISTNSTNKSELKPTEKLSIKERLHNIKGTSLAKKILVTATMLAFGLVAAVGVMVIFTSGTIAAGLMNFVTLGYAFIVFVGAFFSSVVLDMYEGVKSKTSKNRNTSNQVATAPIPA